MIFAMAAMQENCVFINGSPQNTLCPALTQVPGSRGIMVGNDFKTGQTKFKTAFIVFLFFFQLGTNNNDEVVVFNMQTRNAAKTFWKVCVNHHVFFRYVLIGYFHVRYSFIG